MVFTRHGANGVKESMEVGFEVLHVEEHIGWQVGMDRLAMILGRWCAGCRGWSSGFRRSVLGSRLVRPSNKMSLLLCLIVAQHFDESQSVSHQLAYDYFIFFVSTPKNLKSVLTSLIMGYMQSSYSITFQDASSVWFKPDVCGLQRTGSWQSICCQLLGKHDGTLLMSEHQIQHHCLL